VLLWFSGVYETKEHGGVFLSFGVTFTAAIVTSLFLLFRREAFPRHLAIRKLTATMLAINGRKIGINDR